MTDQARSADGPPAALRSAVARDFTAVRTLPAPGRRALVVVPLGLLLLVAAPLAFELRMDAPRLGVGWTWGASIVQLGMGLALVAAALRESVPGRSWRASSLIAWLVLPTLLVIAITWATDAVSQTTLRGSWWTIGALCFVGSFVSALPMLLLAGLLAARAYVTRSAATGALLGLGAGVMADGGWRLFCHFSEPGHVLTAHLGAVLASVVLGVRWQTWLLARPSSARDAR